MTADGKKRVLRCVWVRRGRWARPASFQPCMHADARWPSTRVRTPRPFSPLNLDLDRLRLRLRLLRRPFSSPSPWAGRKSSIAGIQQKATVSASSCMCGGAMGRAAASSSSCATPCLNWNRVSFAWRWSRLGRRGCVPTTHQRPTHSSPFVAATPGPRGAPQSAAPTHHRPPPLMLVVLLLVLHPWRPWPPCCLVRAHRRPRLLAEGEMRALAKEKQFLAITDASNRCLDDLDRRTRRFHSAQPPDMIQFQSQGMVWHRGVDRAPPPRSIVNRTCLDLEIIHSLHIAQSNQSARYHTATSLVRRRVRIIIDKDVAYFRISLKTKE